MIVIFNEKGGVGKTNLAHSIARDLKWDYITNDASIVTSVYDKARFIDNKLPIEKNTIYDLGGFITAHVSDVLKKADKVVIPTICDYNALLKAIKVIDYVGVDKAVVVANMIDNPKELQEIQEVILKSHPTIKILPLKRSKAFRNGLEEGMSLLELSALNGLNKHTYRSVMPQYQAILKELK